MQTRDGTVVVEVDQPDAEVRVLDEKGKVEVSRKGGEGIVTIGVDPGKHRLVVEKDGFEAYGEEFILSSGGRREIAARLVPLAAGRPTDAPAREPVAPAMKDDAPQTSDGADSGSADRRAAEWAMQHGAEVVISTASGRKTLASGGSLPVEGFRVHVIRRPQRIDWQKETLDFLPDLAALEGLYLWETPVSPAALETIAPLQEPARTGPAALRHQRRGRRSPRTAAVARTPPAH